MRWIKKFESIEIDYKDYFQELVDSWFVGLSDEDGKLDYYLIISIENNKDFPSVRNNASSWTLMPDSILNQSVISFRSKDFDNYCKFMIDLHECLNHFISATSDYLSFTEVIQDQDSIIWIKFKKLG